MHANADKAPEPKMCDWPKQASLALEESWPMGCPDISHGSQREQAVSALPGMQHFHWKRTPTVLLQFLKWIWIVLTCHFHLKRNIPTRSKTEKHPHSLTSTAQGPKGSAQNQN